MLTLPDAIVAVLVPFATLFTKPTPGRGRGQAWRKAQVLLVGAILTPGQRTVTAALRVMGRSDQRDYARYHEVLNRAVWSPRQAARILLMLLLQHLDQGDGPLVFGIDETLERRRGPKIKSLGIYRDAVRSSRSHMVKASGLRWISLMWLGHITLGRSPLGLAGAHGAGPLGTVLPPAGAPPQKAHRLGAADDLATAPLAAPPPPGAGGRQQLCRAGPAPLLPVVWPSRLPSSPVCAWTPPSTHLRHPVSRVRTVARR